MDNKSSRSKIIQKSVKVLRAFSSDTPNIGVRDIARKVGIPKSTVHRILIAFEQEGLVEKDANTNRYHLGLELVAIAGTALRNVSVRKVALPFMNQLSVKWKETVDVDILRGDQIMIIEQIPGPHILNTGGLLAALLPAHCTSTGKVLLAYAGHDYVYEHLPEKLVPFTPNTITTRKELLVELDQIRQQGFARSWEEYEINVHALGAPIRNLSGEVIAAMSVSGPATRIDKNIAEEILKDLIEVTTRISAGLGYSEDRF